MYFTNFGVFLISVKPLTTENTKNKTAPKFCKITKLHRNFVKLQQCSKNILAPNFTTLTSNSFWSKHVVLSLQIVTICHFNAQQNTSEKCQTGTKFEKKKVQVGASKRGRLG